MIDLKCENIDDRFNDICIGVRTTCVQFAQLFILNHPELVKDILGKTSVVSQGK